ncbi:F-box domain [Macleaya cordata]|uniref:F-box domain n=1 Tax=Macleaya cordata TaxID=56857 RepID=A0A200QAU9_MACCD|nr:F-box domain [Macleaya cordata]
MMRKLIISINDDKYDDDDAVANTESSNPWNKLDDVMVETLLAQLPTIEILRCQFVCKRWRTIIHSSPTFSITSKQLFNSRGRPWFFMFNSSSSSSTCVVYDMEVSDWRHVHLQIPTTTRHQKKKKVTNKKKQKTRPVASSGGLICFRTGYYSSLIVKNPLTGASLTLPKVKTHGELRGIAMHASKSESGGSNNNNYKIFVLFGHWRALVLKVYSWSSSSSSSEDQDHHHHYQDEAAAANNYWKELPAREVIINECTREWWPREYTFDPQYDDIDEMVGVTTLGYEGQILVHYLDTSLGILLCFDTLPNVHHQLSSNNGLGGVSWKGFCRDFKSKL